MPAFDTADLATPPAATPPAFDPADVAPAVQAQRAAPAFEPADLASPPTSSAFDPADLAQPADTADQAEAVLRKYGVDVLTRFAPQLKALDARGWLHVTPQGVRLSRDGLLRADRLVAAFYQQEHVAD